jgi:hypothetical protein
MDCLQVELLILFVMGEDHEMGDQSIYKKMSVAFFGVLETTQEDFTWFQMQRRYVER